MLPSEYPEVQSYPHLKRLLQNQVDPQIIDLRTLLCLPQPGLESNCSFTAAGVLLNLIAGISVCFFDASIQALHRRGDRGTRFKEVLRKFYPWHEEPLAKEECVQALYNAARNPLIHSLGLDDPPTASPGRQVVFLKKRPLTEAEVQELEDASSRPLWVSSTIVHHLPLAYGSIEVAISVPALYWGVHRLLQALFADATQAKAANTLAEEFSLQWDKSASDTGYVQETATVVRRCSTCGANLVSIDGGQSFQCPCCHD